MADNQRVDVGNLSDLAREGTIVLFIEQAKNKEYAIVPSARWPFEVQSVGAKAGSGSCAYTIKIAGQEIAGLTDEPISTGSLVSSTPDSTATVDTAERLVVELGNVSSALDVEIQVNWRRDIP